MSSRFTVLPADASHINVFIVLDLARGVARMTVVESRSAVYETLGEPLPTDGTEVVGESARWSLTEAHTNPVGSDAYARLAAVAADSAALLPAGPARRTQARRAALFSVLTAASDARVR